MTYQTENKLRFKRGDVVEYAWHGGYNEMNGAIGIITGPHDEFGYNIAFICFPEKPHAVYYRDPYWDDQNIARKLTHVDLDEL